MCQALRKGKASVVTDHIDHFTETGIALQSGEHVDGEVIVTATGLVLQKNFPMSTVRVSIDGKAYKVRPTRTHWCSVCVAFCGLCVNRDKQFGRRA